MKYLIAITALLSTTTSLLANPADWLKSFQRTGNLGMAVFIFIFMTVMAFKCFQSALWRIITIAGTALVLLLIGSTR